MIEDGLQDGRASWRGRLDKEKILAVVVQVRLTGLPDEREQQLGCARLTSIEDVGAVEEGRRKAPLAKEGTWAVQSAGIAGPDTQIASRTGVPCRSLIGSGRWMELSLQLPKGVVFNCRATEGAVHRPRAGVRLRVFPIRAYLASLKVPGRNRESPQSDIGVARLALRWPPVAFLRDGGRQCQEGASTVRS